MSASLWPTLSQAMLIGPTGVNATFSVNGGAATDTPPGVIRITDGTPVSLEIDFALNAVGPAGVGVAFFPAWAKTGPGAGDFASGPKGGGYFATLTNTSRFSTYTYVINNTGYDDGDGDKWSFLFPGATDIPGGLRGLVLTANNHSNAEGPFHDEWDPRIYLSDTGKPPPAPEPATWALMLMGVGGVGSALRATRRRERAVIGGG